jgi:hypothetical protein
MDKKRKNLLMFVEDTPSNSLFFGRITKYLQPDMVAWAWEANTDEQFITHTEKPGKSHWGVLITENKIFTKKRKLFNKFIKKNPDVTIGIIYESREKIPANPPLENAIMIEEGDYGDIDDWLAVMYKLLSD